jgi:radical SAM protein with 4Fe4S-binding SPASM domain
VRVPTLQDKENPHPLYCVWEITLACDLGCKHCGSRAGKARSDELTTAECLDVVHQMHELGIREVTLIGGEAYLRDDWDVIAREITGLGMKCGMTTGARNLSEDRIARAVDAGLSTISISIDGLEHTHDAQRGVKGSWRNAVEAAERVAATPIRLATNSQINRLSMPELAAIGTMLGDIGSRAWQIQLTVAMGRAADRPDMLLQPYHLLELFPLLVWIKQTRLEPAGVKLFPGNNIGYFGPYESKLRYGGEKGAHWQSCSAGKWSIGLEADGKIKGCPSLTSEHWTGGNLRDDRLADVVQNAPELTFLKNRTVEDLHGFCRSCHYASVCKAGCTWTTQVLFGKTGNNPYCIHRAIEHQKQGLRERLQKVANAPGKPFDHGLFEIIVEDLPPVPDDQLPPTIGDVDVDRVVNLHWKEGSVWPKEKLRETLLRSALGGKG